MDSARHLGMGGRASDAHDDRLTAGERRLVNIVARFGRKPCDGLGRASGHAGRDRRGKFRGRRWFFGVVLHGSSEASRRTSARANELARATSRAYIMGSPQSEK